MATTVTLKQVLEFGATIEKTAADFYAKVAAQFTGDPLVGDVFSKLAQEEIEHHNRFRDLSTLVPNVEKVIDEDHVQYLRAMANSPAFSPETGPLKDIDKVSERSEALAQAIEFEKATLAYYQAIRDTVGPNEVLDSLVNMERTHVITLMRIAVSGGELRSLEDPWA